MYLFQFQVKLPVSLTRDAVDVCNSGPISSVNITSSATPGILVYFATNVSSFMRGAEGGQLRREKMICQQTDLYFIFISLQAWASLLRSVYRSCDEYVSLNVIRN